MTRGAALERIIRTMDRRKRKLESAKSEIVKGFQEAVAGAADIVSNVLSRAESPATPGSKPGAYSGGRHALGGASITFPSIRVWSRKTK